MNDLISRQAAIDILDAYQVMAENGEEKPYTWARLRMSELPSVQPERKKGEWIYGENLGNGQDGYFCDRCGWFVAVNYDFPINSEENKPTNFCPNCGAKMEEGKQK